MKNIKERMAVDIWNKMEFHEISEKYKKIPPKELTEMYYKILEGDKNCMHQKE